MMVAPLARRPEAWLRIGAAAGAVALLAVSVPLGATIYRGTILVLFAGVVLHVSAIPVALLRPWMGASLSAIGAVTVMTCASAGTAPWPWSVTTMITQGLVLMVLGFRAPWPLGAGTLLAVLALSGAVTAAVPQARDQQALSTDLVVFTFTGGTGLVAGIVAREWQRIRRQLAGERRLTEGERTRRLLAEEKTRIARELHDVIAHSMSIISVQAASAPSRHPGTSDELSREFEAIAESSRRALAEMRSLLDVLRDPDAASPRAPAPGLSDIPELVRQSRRSGLSVELFGARILLDAAQSESIGMTAYRVVQEALSNIMRHAPGARAEVRVECDDALRLAVVNTPAVAVGPPNRTAEAQKDHGSGLQGMHDRAAAVGGSVAYGPTATGGFEVHLTLPLAKCPSRAEGGRS